MYSKKWVSVSACGAIYLFGVGLITLGAVVPELKQRFQLDAVSAGTLFSILPLGILTGSLLFGPIADRFGFRALLFVSCLFMFAGFEGIAFSNSLLLLKVAVFLFGTGGGSINGATSAVIADISDDKGAALNILGVFFGLGALSMPFMLGLLQGVFSSTTIIAFVGTMTLLTSMVILSLKFPPSKHTAAVPVGQMLALMKEPFLLLIAFFLFCQSSFEGIINNWTTSFLTTHLSIDAGKALYALSLYLAGMTGMRLLLGTVLKTVRVKIIVWLSFIFIGMGILLLQVASAYGMAIAGLISIGAGFGGGFPVMLGLAGNRYAHLSGTAFSIILTIALAGNIMVNYAMGFVVQNFGIQQLLTASYLELIVMIILGFFILKRI